MANPYVGQLSLVGFNFAPYPAWVIATGQVLPINKYTALFALLGTAFGGDGRTTFGLPNLQGAAAVGTDQGLGNSFYPIGATGGQTNVTLNVNQTPNHTHPPKGDSTRRNIVAVPAGNSFADSGTSNLYSSNNSPLAQMSPNAVTVYGSGLAHNNMMPYLGLYWVIALTGIFPPRS